MSNTENAPGNSFKNSYALLLRHAGVTRKDLFIPFLVAGKLHDHVSRESQVRLVHGQVFMPHVNGWWDHAWVEIVKPYRSKYDMLTVHWQIGLDAWVMPYPHDRLRAQRRYTVDEALAMGLATGHFGPWRLSKMEAKDIASQMCGSNNLPVYEDISMRDDSFDDPIAQLEVALYVMHASAVLEQLRKLKIIVGSPEQLSHEGWLRLRDAYRNGWQPNWETTRKVMETNMEGDVSEEMWTAFKQVHDTLLEQNTRTS